MIRFLYEQGTDRTAKKLQAAIREVLDAGDNAILLVPEQETVNAERRMLEILPASSQLNFEALNFTRLANRVAREVGGLCHDNVTPAAEIMLLYRTLRELAPLLLQYDAKTTANLRFCEKLLAAKGQFHASSISPALLLKVAEECKKNTTSDEKLEELGKKLWDLGTIFVLHDTHLDHYFSNRRDDLAKLPDILKSKGHALFEKTHIFIDSFTDFTGQECEILMHLFSLAAGVTVTFPTPDYNKEGLQFLSVSRTEKKLRGFADKVNAPISIEEASADSPDSALSYLRRELFSMAAVPAPEAFTKSGDIVLTKCKNPMSEAAYVANLITRLVREGAQYSDIAVVARDATQYIGLIDAALEKENIPYYISEKVDLTQKPLLKLILSALRILRYDFCRDDIIGYLKTGLCGIHRDEITFFEDYLSVWNFRGKRAYTTPFAKNPDGIKAELTDRGARILRIAEDVRTQFLPPILKLEADLNTAKTPKEQISAIFGLLSELKISEALRDEASKRFDRGHHREAEELSRLFTATCEALETAATVLGDQPYSVKELEDVLTLAFSHTDIGTIPTSADAVTVGSASMLRTDRPKYVIVIGLNEGEFPKPVKNEGLLNDTERKKLASFGTPSASDDSPERANNTLFDKTERERLDALRDGRLGDSEAAASDELFYVWRAFTAPRKRLYLSRSTGKSDGSAASASMAWNRVTALFEGIPEVQFEDLPILDRLYSPKGAEELYADCNKNEQAALHTLLRTYLPQSPILGSLTIQAPNATIPENLAVDTFQNKKMSPTQLEKYAKCRFAYYCAEILNLRTDANDSFSSSELGSYIHFVLEKAISALRARDRKDPFSDQEINRMIREIATTYKKKLFEKDEPTPRTEAIFARLELLAGVVVRGLFEDFENSQFTPAFLELSLKDLGEAPYIKLKNGEKLPISGIADRVDFWAAPDGTAYCRIVDYKTGSRKFDLDAVREGVSMQMPLYLSAICKNKTADLRRTLGLPDNARIKPAGISYLMTTVSSAETPVEAEREGALRSAIDRIRSDGVLLDNEEVKNALTISREDMSTEEKKSKSYEYISEEGFEQLFADLSTAVTDITSNMKKGAAEAVPRTISGSCVCDYCSFKAICRVAPKPKKQ